MPRAVPGCATLPVPGPAPSSELCGCGPLQDTHGTHELLSVPAAPPLWLEMLGDHTSRNAAVGAQDQRGPQFTVPRLGCSLPTTARNGLQTPWCCRRVLGDVHPSPRRSTCCGHRDGSGTGGTASFVPRSVTSAVLSPKHPGARRTAGGSCSGTVRLQLPAPRGHPLGPRVVPGGSCRWHGLRGRAGAREHIPAWKVLLLPPGLG